MVTEIAASELAEAVTLVALHRRIIAAGTPYEVISPMVLEQTFGAPMEVLEHLGMPVVLDRYDAGNYRGRASA